MTDIRNVITFTYNLLNNTYLTFGNFTFSLFAILLTGIVIPIFIGFIYKLFDSI